MLRKENRLRKNRDFQNIQKSGRYYNGGFVGIKVYESDRDTARIGIIAANKIFNNAPERNKARRRVREILRARVGRIEKGQDIVIILKSGINAKSFIELSAAIDSLLKRANLFPAN